MKQIQTDVMIPNSPEPQMFIQQKRKKDEKKLVSYDDSLFDISLDELAEERHKTTSVYYELLNFVKTLSIGVDLTKIASPIFIIRPISFLELFSEYAQPSNEYLR